MVTRLPSTPNFDLIDSHAGSGEAQRKNVLTAIGNLVFSWSNNESVFIYLLMELLDTDFQSAAITFISLNTTRARLDLVRRLGKTHVSDRRLLRRLERLIDRFNDCTKVRNEFNHCIYQVDEMGRIVETQTLRISEAKQGVLLGEVKKFDSSRFGEIERTIKKLTVLNRDLWRFLPEIEQHLNQIRRAKPRSR